MDISGGNLIVRNNNLYLTRGDASINGNLLLGYDLSVNGNIYGNTNTVNSLVVSNNISMNGVFAQFNRDVDVPASDLYTVDLTTYLKKTDMTSYSSNNINILTPFYVNADVSLNSRLFLTGDASFGGKLFAIGDVSLNNDLFVGLDASFSGKLFVNGDVSMNSRLFVASDASINGLTLGKGGGNISSNTVFGYQALNSNTTGGNIVAVGFQSLFLNSTGSDNASFGYQSLFYNTGSLNTAVGRAALLENRSGNNNTAVGYQAGTAGTSNTTGSNNTYIGYQAQANGNNYTKSTALGSGATITASNQVVLGTSTETVVIPNQINFNYTSNPTLAVGSLGYIYTYSVAQTLGIALGSQVTIASFSNVPVGIYSIYLTMTSFDYATNTITYVYCSSSSNFTFLTNNSTMECPGSASTKFPINMTFLVKATSSTNSIVYSFKNNSGSGTPSILAATNIMMRIA
jgi:hypothetical protein